MIPNFSALEAARSVRDSYRDYLLSAFHFADESIRREFRESLDEQFPLSKGPYVQSTPPYKRSKSLIQLAESGLLSEEILRHPALVPNADRALYEHQVSAIEKIAAGRNVIVATGTGSGKTEAFLFPILDYLLKEKELGTLGNPGVRAMLLYPMNALANDQLGRLRELLGNVPDVTFGRFTGDTGHEDEAGQAREYRRRFGRDPLPNEMLSRDRMRETPPHILVTNFVMLEYLLLQPASTRFFDGPTGSNWKFIVLDEVHTYQGAKGGEIRMLLKRLRDRVAASTRNRIKFIGTSATIGSDPRDTPKLARFATLLFDEAVEYDESNQVFDVIRPQFEERKTFECNLEISTQQLLDLSQAVAAGDDSSAARLLTEIDSQDSSEVPIRQRLGRVLVKEARFQALQSALSQGPLALVELAERVFGQTTATDAVTQLIDLAKFAEIPGDTYPLLSARYHMFVRALEGMFRCFNPSHPESVPRISLEPHEHCPACSVEATSSMFEIGPCIQCGATFVIGKLSEEESGPRLSIPDAYGSNNVYLTPASPAGASDEDSDEDDDALVATTQVPQDLQDIREFCSICGALDESEPTCPHTTARQKFIHARPKDADSPLRRCPACLFQSCGSVVNKVQTGQDAPNAILATSIYQQLPPAVEAGDRIGAGRKLLCFSDSRQDAAFFAPYLERTYMRNVQRRLLMDSLLAIGEPVRFEELTKSLARRAKDTGVLEENTETSPESEARKWLIREALNIDGRLSLIGNGLIHVTCRLPSSTQPPVALMDAGLSESESFHLLQALLGIIREKGVVDLPETLDISDPIFAPRNFVFRMRETSDGRILGWSPAQGRTNARLNYLSRVLNDNEESPLTREILGKLWTELTSRISPWVTLFSVDQARSVPSLCLNYKMFDFRAVDSSDVLFVCDTCKRVTLTNVRNICPRYRCSGRLVTSSEAGGRRDHYEALYTKQLPIGMKVEEHTAQLSTEHASDIQQDFVDGRVNTLSCSTTFELGVDLGEIRAVLMKNVPPTAANYAQRAGRAGRRTSSTALVTTFAQRRNHDLFYFSNPEGLVNGVVQAPQISVSNTLIIRRHVHSVALASFARQYVDEGGEWSLRINVGEFFHDTTPDGMTLAERFEFWLRSGPETLSKSLTRIIDDEASRQELGISEWQWVEDLYADTTSTEKGWMRRAESVITELLTNIEKLITEKEAQLALERRGTGKAIALSRSLELLNKQAKTVRERRLIDYLAQMIVLPKYGFPVDVVSLDILSPDSTEGSKLELTRDLQVAILDFAPSSTTVANKRLWESNGLRIPQDKALPEFHWRVCIKCDTFRTLKEPGNDLGCDVCGSHEVKPHSPAIVPSFGFLGRPSEEKPGDARPSRVGYLRSYFTEFGGQLPELETIRIGTGSVGVRVGREGVITVLNQGPRNSGFDICLRCGGATAPSPAKKRRRVTQDEEPHSRPGLSKSECKTHRHRRVLGHQFRTDAIQIDLPGVVSYSQGESVLAALVAATQKLDIPRDDIKGTTRAGGGGLSRSIVIFDAVPGGAGYARAVRDALPDMFAHAAAISNNCSCGVETSCYGCLRSYSNQFVHESLSRREANSVFTSLGLID